MQIQIPAFGDMPKSLKIGSLLLMGGGGIVGMVWLLWPQIAPIILIGFILLGLIFALYAGFLKYLKKRRSAPMEKGIGDQNTPQGITDPMKIAKLDDLKKKFEEGVAKFKAAGKSLYDFPWYMVVGEPGSGKTEAVRHSNIGFPPGLQDQLQGTGGTINMNWWFTDHAVILDTAGRLMFEQVEAGGSNEWLEFLKLLKKNRSNCPVNGLLLVIPADSLIKDTIDEIEKKASKIAKQFDVIQRTLDVRFPVFVVISKADLIQGFRDFFENIKDPRLQHQILGWSNTAPLDEPFSPGFINQHIAAIRKRLLRRRLGLMQQIVTENDPELDNRQADVLYAFPHNLSKLAPRMSRYLELIFSVGSRWSCKPVFFRGIYFTSSMQEGSALDMELAESLGMPVEDLPDGRVFTRERAFFLRDLFIKKIFPEQGLVTRATNAKKVYTRRRVALYVTAIVSILIMLFFTVYFHFQWVNSIGDLGNYFKYASDNLNNNKLSIVVGKDYAGNSPIRDNNIDLRIPLYKYYSNLGDKVQDVKTPWIFKPAAKMAGSVSQSDMRNAVAKLYETNVLMPFVNVGVSRLLEPKDQETVPDWTIPPGANGPIDALYSLIALNTDRPLSDDSTGYTSNSFLDVFFELAYESETIRQMYIDHTNDLHRPLKMLYPALGETTTSGYPVWPSESLKQATAVKAFVLAENFVTAWEADGGLHPQVHTVVALLREYRKQEQALLDIAKDHPRDFWVAWQKQFENVQAVYSQNEETGLDSLAILAAYDPEKDKQTLIEAFNYLLDPLKSIREEDSQWRTKEILLKNRDRLITDIGQSDKDIQAINERYGSAVDGKTLLQVRHEMYAAASTFIGLSSDSLPFMKIAESVNSLNPVYADAFSSAFSVILARTEDFYPADVTALKTFVRQASAGRNAQIVQLAPFNPDYHPAAAGAVLTQWQSLYSRMNDSQRQKKETIQKGIFQAYVFDFWRYWLEAFPEEYIAGTILSDVKGHLHNDFSTVRRQLETLQREIVGLTKENVYGIDAKYIRDALATAEACQMLNLKTFYERWKQLMVIEPLAAKDILQQDTNLKANYFAFHPENNPGELDKLYGRLLADKALQWLAEWAQSDINERFGQIGEYNRKFPLNKSGSEDLTIEEYNRMRTFLGGLKPSEIIYRTGIDQVDINLKIFGGGDLSAEQRELYNQLKPTLDKLPAPDKPFICRIFLAEADDPVNREKLNRHFFTVRGQWGTQVQERRLNEPQELLTVNYPCNDAVYITCLSEAEPFEIKIMGPWAPLRMAAKAIRIDSEKGILLEQITHYLDLNADNTYLSLKMRLEFFDDKSRTFTEETWKFLKR